MPLRTAIHNCRRCQGPIEETDSYCRACGHSLNDGPDYAQDLYRTVVETIPVGIFTADSSGRIRYWNRAMEEHSGAKRRDALGRMLFEILPHLQPFTHRVMRVFDTALPLRLDQVTHGSGDGTDGTDAFWFRPILLGDESVALLGVMEDITQKVRVDTQLIRSERLAAIGELAAGIAHNFNNILAAIGGDAQLLKLVAQDEDLPPHVAEAAQQIYEETMRGGRIAHDLLSFARGAEPQIQRLHVREVVEDAVRLIKNHPAARLIAIEVTASVDLPQIEGDANQLHQVFFNLMLNALQAMPNGGMLTISASTRGDEKDANAGMVDLKFHDTGVGIPRDHLRRVFDPFYSSRASGTQGSGLGLPVSLTMVKSLGGDIQITSAEGIGTTVTVSLPIVERRTAARGSLRRERQGAVLIIDDDANVRRTLTTLLTRRSFEVVTATEGDEAVARFEAGVAGHPFDVVLLELMLPNGDGLATTARIRALDGEVPIVVLTGVTDAHQLQAALEAGAQFGFSKPPNFSDLLAVVEHLSEERQASEASAPA